MKIGMIGLGRMGANMAERLIAGGHEVVGFDFSPEAVRALESKGGSPAESLESLAGQLEAPRVIWIMVPSGAPVDDTIAGLLAHLDKGDIIIDGGNSFYKDTVRRAAELADKGFAYVDSGTSGGVWGITEGYSLMVGGPDDAVAHLEPIIKTLAPGDDRGWGHVGPSGAGHFVKMVHNGIEYGMMQAFAEGMAIMKRKKEFGLDLHQISEVWRHGSVVRSWLLDLIANALDDNPNLDDIAPFVSDSGEGRWTVFEAIDLDTPAPVITMALLQRLQSRDTDSFANKMLAVMRQQFGGHAIKKKGA